MPEQEGPELRLLWRWRDLPFRCRKWFLQASHVHKSVGLIASIGSFILAWYFNRADIFGRSGAILCLMGGFLTFRKYLRGGENPYLRDTGQANQSVFGPLKHPVVAKREAENEDDKAMAWGIWYVFIGTLVWGYSDLLLIGLHLCDS
jgi:hypothetical protein